MRDLLEGGEAGAEVGLGLVEVAHAHAGQAADDDVERPFIRAANADDLGEAADEGTDDALKAENTGATMQYPNSYWMVCFAFRGARQDTSAIAALCDHNRLGIS